MASDNQSTTPDTENAELGGLLCDHTAVELAHHVLRLQAVLTMAAAQFEFYALQHRLKGTAESEAKAVVNEDWANRCLTAATGHA